MLPAGQLGLVAVLQSLQQRIGGRVGRFDIRDDERGENDDHDQPDEAQESPARKRPGFFPEDRVSASRAGLASLRREAWIRVPYRQTLKSFRRAWVSHSKVQTSFSRRTLSAQQRVRESSRQAWLSRGRGYPHTDELGRRERACNRPDGLVCWAGEFGHSPAKFDRACGGGSGTLARTSADCSAWLTIWSAWLRLLASGRSVSATSGSGDIRPRQAPADFRPPNIPTIDFSNKTNAEEPCAPDFASPPASLSAARKDCLRRQFAWRRRFRSELGRFRTLMSRKSG